MAPRRHISASERVAVFGAAGGRCHVCGERIDGVRERWDVEHVIPLALGGDEKKGSENLRPAHARCHAEKTPEDVGRIAKAKRVAAKHNGARAPKSRLPGNRDGKWKQKIGGGWVRRDERGPSQ